MWCKYRYGWKENPNFIWDKYKTFLIQNALLQIILHVSTVKEYIDKGFDNLFEVCSFAGMSEDMQMKYVRHMMAEWDREGQLATAIMDGEERGRAEEKALTARNMKKKGLDPELISDITGLTLEQIQSL